MLFGWRKDYKSVWIFIVAKTRLPCQAEHGRKILPYVSATKTTSTTTSENGNVTKNGIEVRAR